jgi:hypothetical protein
MVEQTKPAPKEAPMRTTKIPTLIATLAATFAVSVAAAPAAQAEDNGDTTRAEYCADLAIQIKDNRDRYNREKAKDPNSDATAKALLAWRQSLRLYDENCVEQSQTTRVLPPHLAHGVLKTNQPITQINSAP